ncbi:MAG: hypothetical protein GY799_11650 [Desulfobulbaceae bacterium]|nr:hypothetical protein [Desulfobulbaceae bacterium]
MYRTFATQSLLPWLDPGSSKIHLEVSLQKKSLKGHGKLDPPFRFLNSSSPLFHLIHASYRTPLGKPIKEIFLLVQKDHCSFTEKSIPFNNSEIDKVWQDAFSFDGLDGGLESFDSLLDSSVDETSFPLWQSLFYCEKRKCYFHPPCPQCGTLLELCSHDEILSAAGLPLYTKTLERFLFCPSCHADQSITDFFSHDGENVSPNVKSCRALIDGFVQLVNNGLGRKGFPCQTCEEQNDCYSSELANSRIHPFAFYPFRMLTTDAAQLPAQDFVSMLSGAPCTGIIKQPHLLKEPGQSVFREPLQQQEEGIEGVQLFFEDATRSFLEILYLKIALLEQVAQTAFVSQTHLKHPDLRFSIDQFWIDFPNYQGLLPYFWNFKVKPVALGIFPSKEISFVGVPKSLSLYSLALFWFNTLLVNKEQSAVDVQRALAVLLDNESGFKSETDVLVSSMSESRVFGAENIFWHPAAKQLPHLWLDLWQKALGLGWSLLQASFQTTDFTDSVFAGEVSLLAGDVKKALFASKSISESSKEDVSVGVRDTADSEILRILLALQQKWQHDAEFVKEEVVPELEPEEEESDPVPEQAEPFPFEEDLEKTVMLSPDQLAVMIEKGDKKEQGEQVEEEAGQTTESSKVVVEEDLEKTVILNLNDLDSVLSDAKFSIAGSEQQNPTLQSEDITNEDLSETVIISLEELEKLKKGKNGHK